MQHVGLSMCNQRFLPKGRRKNLSGWRKVVACSWMFTVLALICNIAALIWAHTNPKSMSNTFVLYDGDCDYIRLISTWSHLAINIIATLVLSSSNYAMQVLIAPMRRDADAAHRDNRSVAIGMLSPANWKYMSRYKQLLYLGLLLTSIPFHTIFNSVIFDTTSAVNFGMYLVTEDFFDLAPSSNSTSISAGNSAFAIWKSASQRQWTNLTKQDCYSTFSAPYVHNYENVIFVSNTSSATYGESWLANTTWSYTGTAETWFCESRHYNCHPDPALATDWTIDFYVNATDLELSDLYTFAQTDGQVKKAPIQHCVAEPVQESCTIQLSPQILGVVIACNAIKALILALLFCSTFTPLVTTGDAVASYLDEPDPSTNGWAAVSAAELVKDQPRTIYFQPSPCGSLQSVFEVRRRFGKQPWRTERRKYFSGATRSRWVWTLLLCFSYLIFGLAMILCSVDDYESLQDVWREGLGSISRTRLETWYLGFLGTVIVVNVPQIFLSMNYVFYNHLLSSMLQSQEWTSHAHWRSSLRVTDPKGEQRSTYFLSLPKRFSIPLLVASALLHWSLSQSIFFVEVDFAYSNGSADASDSIITAGFSSIGLLMLLPLGTIMVAFLILFGFRRYESGIPLVLSDSRAISAACHPIPRTGQEAAERLSLIKLQYGVVAHRGSGKFHVSFSDGPVEPLVKGEVYTNRVILS